MDEPRSTAVTEAFVRLHERGLMYRKRRMVNWCPHLRYVCVQGIKDRLLWAWSHDDCGWLLLCGVCRTAISDMEVEHINVRGTTLTPPGARQGVEVGYLHTFAYPVEGEETELAVATTRLETMLGDEAVAVHPDDTRYNHLIGRCVVHPFSGKVLPG